MKAKQSHVFKPDTRQHYVENFWCSADLFAVEHFGEPRQSIGDPFCGWGRVLRSAYRAGFQVRGADIVDRGAAQNVPEGTFGTFDFFSERAPGFFGGCKSIVSNPPFGHREQGNLLERIVHRCLGIASYKVALIFPTRRLNAAGPWLAGTPLETIRLMNPRPSMPSGIFLKRGGKAGGGLAEFCWLIFRHGHTGPPIVRWLYKQDTS